MQVEYKTEKGTICFVLLPIGFTLRNISTVNPMRSWIYGVDKNNKEIYIDAPVDFNPIGLTSEITEEQAKMMVDLLKYGMYEHMQCFKDYHNFGVVTFKDGVKSEGYGVELALDSFKSLMQHLQITEEKWIVLFKPNEKI